jgi:hypothetical protein
MKKHQPTYTVLQKLGALDLVKKIGMKPDLREAGIPLCTIKRWRRNEGALLAVANTKGIDPTIQRKQLYDVKTAQLSWDHFYRMVLSTAKLLDSTSSKQDK